MNWNGKTIKDLSDTELLLADAKVKEMKAYYEDQVAKRQKRHENVEFSMNATFLTLMNEIASQIEERELVS